MPVLIGIMRRKNFCKCVHGHVFVLKLPHETNFNHPLQSEVLFACVAGMPFFHTIQRQYFGSILNFFFHSAFLALLCFASFLRSMLNRPKHVFEELLWKKGLSQSCDENGHFRNNSGDVFITTSFLFIQM